MCLLSFVSFYHLITCAFKSTNWISPHPESYRRDWICDPRLLSFLGLLDAVVESPFLCMGLSTCPAPRMGADRNLLTFCLRLISGFIDICKQSDCLACHTLRRSATVPPRAMPQPHLDIFWFCHGKKMLQKAGLRVLYFSYTSSALWLVSALL